MKRKSKPTSLPLPGLVLHILCLGLLVLSSCTTPKDYQSLMKKVTKHDNSFNAGYIDGCDSGLSQDTDIKNRMFFQDINRYNTDTGYASGWDTGFKRCSP